ncbi:hypothetical protein Mal64_27510 [Pseudobythopirellula maris]|uniref:Uncharacterized protein n=1 Tax=Pseudobythopirellula maris TaxID=2527991 RepID=A0A5C5ZLA2_9BACT|nr:hypothetical protein [Pseudobythopirellula maris]TWT87213.1 hypothetical protein Mal64_27510 [Pseudobythopirellula maris]
MPPEMALFTFVAIMSVAICIWFWSLALALRMGRPSEAPESFTVKRPETTGDLVGEITVHGECDEVSKELVRSLRRPSVNRVTSVLRVTEHSPERVVFSNAGGGICNQAASHYFDEGEMLLAPAGDGRVRVHYRIGLSGMLRRFRQLALGMALGLGLPGLLLVGGLVAALVLPSPEPAVRGQVLQTLQVVHVLWLPFLFIHIAKTARRQSRAFIESLIESAESLD